MVSQSATAFIQPLRFSAFVWNQVGGGACPRISQMFALALREEGDQRVKNFACEVWGNVPLFAVDVLQQQFNGSVHS